MKYKYAQYEIQNKLSCREKKYEAAKCKMLISDINFFTEKKERHNSKSDMQARSSKRFKQLLEKVLQQRKTEREPSPKHSN